MLLLPAAFFWPRMQKEKLRKKRQDELRIQFKEGIRFLASSLAAGRSVENAFAAGVSEVKALYGEDAMICREFSYITRQLAMNRPVEQLLLEFAERSGLEEIRQFAEVFLVSKRGRGELIPVAEHVVHVIGDRIQVWEEIQTMTAEKRLEQKIMRLMPPAIVFYIDLTSPGFFLPAYETMAGRLVMTGCLAVYAAACVLSARILAEEW